MRLLWLLLIPLAAGCSLPSLPDTGPIPMRPYKIDVQQGNYVTQDMVAKLRPGMTRSQVRFALGTPLVADPFHADRWDYVYHMQKRGQTTEFRRVVIVFEQDKLARIEGDVVPAGPAKADVPQPAPQAQRTEPANETPGQPKAAARAESADNGPAQTEGAK